MWLLHSPSLQICIFRIFVCSWAICEAIVCILVYTAAFPEGATVIGLPQIDIGGLSVITNVRGSYVARSSGARGGADAMHIQCALAVETLSSMALVMSVAFSFVLSALASLPA